MSQSSKHVKDAVLITLGFVACALLGQQISQQVVPPTAWSPYYWFTFGVAGGVAGAAVADLL